MGLNWEVVATYPFRPTADVTWSILDGHGIPARVVGDDTGGMTPHVGLMTGISVEVPTDRADEAREVLAAAEAQEEPGM